jgi:uncharacterized protein (TIGR02284 family)
MQTACACPCHFVRIPTKRLSDGHLVNVARTTHKSLYSRDGNKGAIGTVQLHLTITLKSKPMNSNIKDTVKTLNHLIEVLKDGEEGFKKAASEVKSAELTRTFERYATQRTEFAAELQARVLALGASVETSGSVAGDIHRGWINLKSALSTNEPHAILAEAERGEDSAVAAYRDAIKSSNLDHPTQDIVSRQYADVKAAHDHIKSLRDANELRKAS